MGMMHEFGIMEHAPKPGVRYDSYEPEKYSMIYVDDEFIEPLMCRLDTVDMFWHSLSRPEKGLDYYGITLIPPSAFPAILEIIRPVAELRSLTDLMEQADREKKYIIHYGL